MEDCCAICVEPLEWIGYGPCGHREVCYACTARMRFVLRDKRCCICKQDCPAVYITKAMGDFTTVVKDWNSLLNHSKNSGMGNLLYDPVVEAYFDDEQPFKVIKAMCRLYCSICENAVAEERGSKGLIKKGYIFKNIDALRRHQSSVHKISMCELCLEGRKVFICQQKLYSKSQLEQHYVKGDSEIDGNEEDRGGFNGHPMCAFCKKRFYGDNELYQHMSQEHFTCHICQRARPGHYEYYQNYDDLEAHFRQEHALCEHADCLAKKFVVFQSEAELKRHNASSHGGHMSRAQRNAALQIPVSFHYRRAGQETPDDVSGYSTRRGGRGRGGAHPQPSIGRNGELGEAVRASVETANLEDAVRESLAISASTDGRGVGDSPPTVERTDSDDPELSASRGLGESEQEPSRYLAAVWSGGGRSALGDAAFPPLSGSSSDAQRRPKAKNQGPASLAALLGGGVGLGGNARGGIRVLNTASASRPPPTSSQPRSSPSPAVEIGRHSHTNRDWKESAGTMLPRKDERGRAPPGSAVITPEPPPAAIRGATGGEHNNVGNRMTERGRGTEVVGASRQQQGTQIKHLSVEDIRAGNKALVDKIRRGLEGNEQQFADFKVVSALFRKGEMSSQDYYVHIARLGLSYIVPELARLCPDPRKGQELMNAHAAELTHNVVDPKSLRPGLAGAFASSSSDQNVPGSAFGSDLGGNYAHGTFRPVAREGAPARMPADSGEVEVLSTDGYRTQKGKSKAVSSAGSTNASGATSQRTLSTEGTLLNELATARDRTPQVLVRSVPPLVAEPSDAITSSDIPPARLEGEWACGVCTLVNGASSIQCAACGTGKPGEEAKVVVGPSNPSEKRKKKTPKFQRLRLGDGSASLFDTLNPGNPWAQATQQGNESATGSGPHSRSVWSNGDAKGLFH